MTVDSLLGANVLTNSDIIVVGPGVNPVYRGPHPALVRPLLLVPEEEGHSVPRVVRVAEQRYSKFFCLPSRGGFVYRLLKGNKMLGSSMVHESLLFLPDVAGQEGGVGVLVGDVLHLVGQVGHHPPRQDRHHQ